ncbi:MAG: hypothetical protein NVSMB48_10960 [Marmoricola sp.]
MPIVNVADWLIALSASRSEIVYTDLGEVEDMPGKGEGSLRTAHALIIRAPVPPPCIAEPCAAMQRALHLLWPGVQERPPLALMRQRQSRDGS